MKLQCNYGDVRFGEDLSRSTRPPGTLNKMAKINRPEEIDIPQWLRCLPKAELHVHLEGTVLPETLVELSRRHDAEPLTFEDASKLYIYKDFVAFLMAFKAVSERLQTTEDFELIAYNMIRDLAHQGVVHAEVYISWGILARFKPHLAIASVMDAIERARTRAELEFGTTIFWIIDAVRHFGVEEAARVFRMAMKMQHVYPSIIGIGIGGDEARGPADQFRDLYAEARNAGLRLTVHAGESTGPIAGPASIWSAINIGAERIGHALAAQHDPELLSVLAERQIPLELNVTSNLRTGCCPTLEQHPIREYFDRGLMVTLNSDDPPMFGSDLLSEYILVQQAFGFSLGQMREFAANSIEASFLPPARKLKLLRDIELYS
jgi:adenosine deaminase/aminodeoxyfutalosine deaminase